MTHNLRLSLLQNNDTTKRLQNKQPLIKINEVERQLTQNQLNQKNDENVKRVTSQYAIARKSNNDKQKRMKLRDYLFVAKSSLEKNNQKIRQLKRSVSDKGQLSKSIEKIKKGKFSLTNQEVHRILKKQLQQEMEVVLKNLQQDFNYVKGLNLDQVCKEDLVFLHEVRGIIMRKIGPALKQINDINFKRQGNIIKQILFLGEDLKETDSVYQQPQSPKIHQQRNAGKDNDINQQALTKQAKASSFLPTNFIETLLNFKNP